MPQRIEHRLNAAAPEDNGDETTACPVPKQESPQEMKANMMLGLKGQLAQFSQAGAFGAVVIGAALIIGFMLMWVRNDAKEQLKQQSVERAEDREARSADRAEDRAARKEAAAIQASAMEKLASAIGEFRVEIRTRDDKITTAMDKLTEKIERRK